jgi:type II secretory pathway pseudopilin PulG
MMALIEPFLPYILVALSLIGGAFGVAWGRKTAQTAKAQATAAEATAQVHEAQAQTAEAQANQAAAQTGAAAVAARTEIDNAIAAKPADEVRNDLKNWTR